jgi:hypothetical protein
MAPAHYSNRWTGDSQNGGNLPIARGTESTGVLKGEEASMSQIHKRSPSEQTGLPVGRVSKPVSMEATWKRTLKTARQLEWIIQARLKEPALTPKEARTLKDLLLEAKAIQSLRLGGKR